MLSNYYPETLGACLILGAGWVFQGCWKLIKPLINKVTADKIRFCQKSDLLQYFDAGDLPEYLGGTLKWTYQYPPAQLPQESFVPLDLDAHSANAAEPAES